MTARIQLTDRLDYQTLPALVEEVKAVEDDELIFDASRLRHLGALSLQLLLSTVQTRAKRGQTTRLEHPSEGCQDMLRLFGFTSETLTQPEAWT